MLGAIIRYATPGTAPHQPVDITCYNRTEIPGILNVFVNGTLYRYAYDQQYATCRNKTKNTELDRVCSMYCIYYCYDTVLLK